MKLSTPPSRITHIVWLVCIILAFIISTLTGCVVIDEAQYRDPLYREHVIIYDVWPQSNYFYNTTYVYSRPRNKKPRHNSNHHNKPRKHRKSTQNNVRGPR